MTVIIEITRIQPGMAERPGMGSTTVGLACSRCTAVENARQSVANHHRQMRNTCASTASAIGIAQRKKLGMVRCALIAMVMPTGPNGLAAEPVLVAKTSMMRNGMGLTL